MTYMTSGFIIVVVLVLYRWYDDKRIREENGNEYNDIQKYLLNDVGELMQDGKPILWIHIPYEHNARQWGNFVSRSSVELNQPYLYLTVSSIISKCDQSFKICLIDDNTFGKLIPNWNINLKTISYPILYNVRELGLMKLVQMYGGMVCPISFLCVKDLIGIYEKGVVENKMFVCENINNNITSTHYKFYPDISFCGADRGNETVSELINHIQHIISTDSTAESKFTGGIDAWCKTQIDNSKIIMIDGRDIGIKNINEEPIKIEDLMSSNYIELYDNTYGILIPAKEILKRQKYEWFARLSTKQVLDSDTIIGKYLLLTTARSRFGKLAPFNNKPSWVGFWKTPDVSMYGLKPSLLGDHVIKETRPVY
jgi:hypothetical protein